MPSFGAWIVFPARAGTTRSAARVPGMVTSTPFCTTVFRPCPPAPGAQPAGRGRGAGHLHDVPGGRCRVGDRGGVRFLRDRLPFQDRRDDGVGGAEVPGVVRPVGELGLLNCLRGLGYRHVLPPGDVQQAFLAGGAAVQEHGRGLRRVQPVGQWPPGVQLLEQAAAGGHRTARAHHVPVVDVHQGRFGPRGDHQDPHTVPAEFRGRGRHRPGCGRCRAAPG